MNHKHWLLSAFASLALMSVLPTASKADSTYTYSGIGTYSNFCNGTYGTTPFCVGEVTGSLILATPLGDNFNGAVTPLSFSFSDGENVKFTSSDSIGLVQFTFTTNGSGNIVAWDVTLDQDNTVNHTCSDTTAPDSVLAAYGSIFNGQFGAYSCYNIPGATFGAGSINLTNPSPTPTPWSVSTTASPEPSSLLLLCIGVLGAVCFSLRRGAA